MALRRLLRCLPVLPAAAVLLPVLAVSTAASATDPQSPVQSAREVLSDSRYQSDLPSRPPPKVQTQQPQKATQKPQRSSEPSRPRAGAPRQTSGPANFDGTWLYIVAGVLGVALAAFVVITLLRGRGVTKPSAPTERRRRRKYRAASEQTPAGAKIDEPTILDETDRLAAEGRYSEAIHVLLLTGLDHVARHTRRRIPPALTSREILRALPMATAMADALKVLVGLSERGHFGDRALSEADYQVSREKFRLFGLESDRTP